MNIKDIVLRYLKDSNRTLYNPDRWCKCDSKNFMHCRKLSLAGCRVAREQIIIGNAEEHAKYGTVMRRWIPEEAR